MNTDTNRSTQPIPMSRMRELLHDGTAVALLPGHFPAPICIDGVWWIVPVDTPARDFVPATPEQSAGFELAAQRLRAPRTTAQPEQA